MAYSLRVVRVDADLMREYVESGEMIPTRQLEVYLLCVRDGLTVHHAAGLMGVSRNAVRNRLQALRQAARRYTTAAASDSARGAA